MSRPIEQAKELKALAVTAAEWATRKGMGEDLVLVASFVALVLAEFTNSVR
jgi:hypothetical protein